MLDPYKEQSQTVEGGGSRGMYREAEQGRRAVHSVFPANYVTLQQLKDMKELQMQKEEEEEEKKKKKKKKRQEEEWENQVQRQEEEEKKKQQEQERRKLKEPSIRTRSSLPPNYVSLQQLKEWKEKNLDTEEEDGMNKQEEEEKRKIREQRPRRNGSGRRNNCPSDLGQEESTREDLKKNLQQAAKSGTIATEVAKDDRGRSGRWRRDGDRKAFSGSVGENPAHQKNGGAPSDGHQEDPTVGPCVGKIWHRNANIGESAMKGCSDSETQRTKGNRDTDLRNKGSLAAGKIAQLVSKGELVRTEVVGLVVEGNSVTAKDVTAAPEETEGKETKGEKGQERKGPFKKKRTKKKPQNQAQASEDSGKTAAVVPVTENVPADEDRPRDGGRAGPEKQERKGKGSVRGVQKDLARKMVLAASTNERQRRSWRRASEKRASLMWVKKGEIPGN